MDFVTILPTHFVPYIYFLLTHNRVRLNYWQDIVCEDSHKWLRAKW